MGSRDSEPGSTRLQYQPRLEYQAGSGWTAPSSAHESSYLGETRCLLLKVTQSCRLFATPWTVHGILQARTLEWAAFPFSRGSSQPKDRTQVSHIAGRCFYHLSHQGSPHMWHHLHVLQRLAHRFSSAQILPYHSTPYRPPSYIPVILPFSASCHFLQGKYVH